MRFSQARLQKVFSFCLIHTFEDVPRHIHGKSNNSDKLTPICIEFWAFASSVFYFYFILLTADGNIFWQINADLVHVCSQACVR